MVFVGEYAGSTNNSACILCQAGTYWTGVGEYCFLVGTQQKAATIRRADQAVTCQLSS